MRLCLDSQNALILEAVLPGDTVQDLLDAVDVFLESHPLPCEACAESCCKKPWAVEADNVFARRMAGGDGEALGRFVRERLALKFNDPMEINQYVLKKQGSCPLVTPGNRCTVYAARPVICRLYVCAPRSRAYDDARSAVAATYLQALVLEQAVRERRLSPAEQRRCRENPAFGASDYSAKLLDIFAYARKAGWFDDSPVGE